MGTGWAVATQGFPGSDLGVQAGWRKPLTDTTASLPTATPGGRLKDSLILTLQPGVRGSEKARDLPKFT